MTWDSGDRPSTTLLRTIDSAAPTILAIVPRGERAETIALGPQYVYALKASSEILITMRVKADPAVPVVPIGKKGGIIDWIEDNPWLVAGGAVAVLLLLSSGVRARGRMF